MNNSRTPPIDQHQLEPGIRHDGKLVRDMTDVEVASYLEQAKADFQRGQTDMQLAVVRYGNLMAIANVLAFEHERRTRKLQVIGSLRGLHS
jgi:hypothetical protein